MEDITDEQRDRRKFDEQRVEETNLYAQRIEEKLNAEILMRKEADAALDKLAQTRLDTVQEALVQQMQSCFRELKTDIESAKERLGETERKLVEVREKNERELKACKLDLGERLDRIQAGMRVEAKTRREEDEKTAKHLTSEISLLKDAVKKEKLVREDENKLIIQRLEVLEHEEIKAGERAQLKIFEQLRELRRVLQLEKEARLVEEDKVSSLSRLAHVRCPVLSSRWVLPGPGCAGGVPDRAPTGPQDRQQERLRVASAGAGAGAGAGANAGEQIVMLSPLWQLCLALCPGTAPAWTGMLLLTLVGMLLNVCVDMAQRFQCRTGRDTGWECQREEHMRLFRALLAFSLTQCFRVIVVHLSNRTRHAGILALSVTYRVAVASSRLDLSRYGVRERGPGRGQTSTGGRREAPPRSQSLALF
eukprot:1866663-Rhodomonas_salina.1